MDTKSLITDIDSRIAKLELARAALIDIFPALATAKPQRGRLKGSGKKSAKRSKLSAEARAKIAAAQRKRWAVAKRAATGAGN
jgi:hypothetical protein